MTHVGVAKRRDVGPGPPGIDDTFEGPGTGPLLCNRSKRVGGGGGAAGMEGTEAPDSTITSIFIGRPVLKD